jgi:hypothetical protein
LIEEKLRSMNELQNKIMKLEDYIGKFNAYFKELNPIEIMSKLKYLQDFKIDRDSFLE